MASLTVSMVTQKDIPICEYIGGRNDGEIVHLNQGPCCENHDKIGSKKKEVESEYDDSDVDSEEEEYRRYIRSKKPQGKRCTKTRRCCEFCMGEIPEAKKVQEITIKDEGKFQVIPKTNGSSHGFVFGSSGSGKSYFVGNYATVYQEFYPENPVYLVSYIDEDSSIDRIPDLIRISIKDIMDGKITGKAIHDSMIIFDDVDALPSLPKEEQEVEDGDEKPVKKAKGKDINNPKDVFNAVEELRDQLLTTGRHHNVSVIVTSHLGANFGHTKKVINESSFITVFPKGGNAAQIERIMSTYSGLNKKQLKKLVDQPSRWVMLSKVYPQYVVSEKSVYLVN